MKDIRFKLCVASGGIAAFLAGEMAARDGYWTAVALGALAALLFPTPAQARRWVR